jgi:hypothetical protein
VRILLRAAPSEDLYGEFSTLAEGFTAEGGFADQGLLVQDAGRGHRWLPRERLAAYLRAHQADDQELLLLLSQPLEEAAGR